MARREAFLQGNVDEQEKAGATRRLLDHASKNVIGDIAANVLYANQPDRADQSKAAS